MGVTTRQFCLPTRVITGLGCFAQLAEVVHRYGQRVLLVCGRRALRSSGALERALGDLQSQQVVTILHDSVQGEPTLGAVQTAVDLARQEHVQVVVGMGGGSAMDVAKAVAALSTQSGAVQEYHSGRVLEQPGLPCVTVPTTAGTGSEVTSNAVLTDPEREIKESLRGSQLFARVAIVDPELTLSLPPALTASGGADALCQAIEPFVGVGAQPITDALAAQAIQWIGRSLMRAYETGSDIAARSDMLYGSLLAGIVLSNARLGGAHGPAHALGYLYHIPHGVVSGMLLPYVMEYSLEWAPEKYARVARLLGAETDGLASIAAAQRGVEIVRSILQRIGIPAHLADLGVRREDLQAVIDKSLSSSNLKNNPRPLGAEDLRAILERAV